MENYSVFQFPNGIRFIHKYVPYTKTIHTGFILDIGSRNEKENQVGLAHFWEHMAFKGTHKRSAYQIIRALEDVGGELNAYTTKEKICFYASFFDKYYEKNINLLTDITFHSVFPPKQIEVERGVILEEISMYKDSPDEALQDEFDTLLFGKHPLGNNILGIPETVSVFKQEDFFRFFNENIDSQKIIFSSVGNLPFAKALKIAEKYLADLEPRQSTHQREKFETYTPTHQTSKKAISQAHQAIGRTAYSMQAPQKVAFYMLNHLLGGPAMSSRLNLALREKNGLVYGIESSFTPYTDTGEWGIYFATEEKNLEKANSLIFREINKLKTQALSPTQLGQLKQQLMGQLRYKMLKLSPGMLKLHL